MARARSRHVTGTSVTTKSWFGSHSEMIVEQLEDDLVVNFVPTGFKNMWFVFEDSPYNAYMPVDKAYGEYMTIKQIEKQYDIKLPESIASGLSVEFLRLTEGNLRRDASSANVPLSDKVTYASSCRDI